MTNKTFAPFELKMTEQQAFDGLKSTYGNELTAADVRAFAAMNNIGYATVTRKIKKFRVSPGKWNLTVTKKSVENIEKSFQSPSAMPAVEKKTLDFDKMSKSELELYGRTIGIELDRRHSKTKLIKELEEKLSE